MNLLQFTIGTALFGAALLACSIVRLIAVVRTSIIVRLPVLREQDVRFPEPGLVMLCIETTYLDSSFGGAGFALTDFSGHDVPSAPILFRTKVSSFSRVRLSIRTFQIPRAGRYRLVVTGVPQGRDMSKSALVFARPFAGALVLWILGIVFGGICLVGGIVLSALRLAGKL